MVVVGKSFPTTDFQSGNDQCISLQTDGLYPVPHINDLIEEPAFSLLLRYKLPLGIIAKDCEGIRNIKPFHIQVGDGDILCPGCLHISGGAKILLGVRGIIGEGVNPIPVLFKGGVQGAGRG